MLQLQAGTAGLIDQLHFADVVTQIVERLQAMFDAPPLVRVDVFGAGEFGPERFVARDHAVGDVGGLDSFGQQARRLEVEKFAGDVDRRDVEVLRTLPVGECGVQLAGFGVDEVGRECTGIAPEKRVRQRAVFPGEADEMQTYE